jgi:type II secretory pathway pseudopilin PulG
MIKFFRKIRKQLIVERKIGNYLFYALGEIVLVVIGILIALAINNYQQHVADGKKEQTYLIGLNEEFNISKAKLEVLIEVNKNNYEGAKKLVKFIDTDSIAITEKQLSQLLYKAFAFDVAFNPNNSLLNEMINSGSVKDIKNTNLRIQLTNWISTMEDIGQQEHDLRIQREKVLNMFRTDENSLRTIFDMAGVSTQIGLPQRNKELSNLGLLESTEFENNLLSFILTAYATETAHYVPLMQDLNAILNLIDMETHQ